MKHESWFHRMNYGHKKGKLKKGEMFSFFPPPFWMSFSCFSMTATPLVYNHPSFRIITINFLLYISFHAKNMLRFLFDVSFHAINILKMWKSVGCPNQGGIYTLRRYHVCVSSFLLSFCSVVFEPCSFNVSLALSYLFKWDNVRASFTVPLSSRWWCEFLGFHLAGIVSRPSKFHISQGACRWLLLHSPAVYLFGHFPELQHVCNSRVMEVFEDGGRIM